MSEREPVIVAYQTVMDGLVLRWYEAVEAADCGTELMSASRSGVMVRCFLHEVPDGWLETAKQAYRDLAAGRDVRQLATHDRRSLGRELVRIDRGRS